MGTRTRKVRRQQKDNAPLAWVRELLERWGEWQRNGAGGVGNIGYPHQAGFLADHFSGMDGQPVIDMSEDIATVEHIMARLKKTFPHYYSALEQYYRYREGADVAASKLKMSRTSYFESKNFGEMYVAGGLSENDGSIL